MIRVLVLLGFHGERHGPFAPGEGSSGPPRGPKLKIPIGPAPPLSSIGETVATSRTGTPTRGGFGPPSRVILIVTPRELAETGANTGVPTAVGPVILNVPDVD